MKRNKSKVYLTSEAVMVWMKGKYHKRPFTDIRSAEALVNSYYCACPERAEEVGKILLLHGKMKAYSVLRKLESIGGGAVTYERHKMNEAEGKKAKEAGANFYRWIEEEKSAIARDSSDIALAITESLWKSVKEAGGKPFSFRTKTREEVIAKRVYYGIPAEVKRGVIEQNAMQKASKAGRAEVRAMNNPKACINGFPYLSLERLIESGEGLVLRAKRYDYFESAEDWAKVYGLRNEAFAKIEAERLKLTETQVQDFIYWMVYGYGEKRTATASGRSRSAIRESRKYIRLKVNRRIEAFESGRKAYKAEALKRAEEVEAMQKAKALKKAEALKAEALKAEALKAEELKHIEARMKLIKRAEARKEAEAREALKAEALKRAEALKVYLCRPEAPKAEALKAEALKRAEALKAEALKAEALKRAEALKEAEALKRAEAEAEAESVREVIHRIRTKAEKEVNAKRKAEALKRAGALEKYMHSLA